MKNTRRALVTNKNTNEVYESTAEYDAKYSKWLVGGDVTNQAENLYLIEANDAHGEPSWHKLQGNRLIFSDRI